MEGTVLIWLRIGTCSTKSFHFTGSEVVNQWQECLNLLPKSESHKNLSCTSDLCSDEWSVIFVLWYVRPHTAGCIPLAAVVSLCNYAPESYGLEREDESAIVGTFAPLQQKSRNTSQKKLLIIKTSK